MRGGSARERERGMSEGRRSAKAAARLKKDSPAQPRLEKLLSPWRRRTTILIVDDDLDGQELLSLILAQEHYRVYTGDDGYQCLELARTLRPDLILLNYRMPGMDGLTALRRLKEDPILFNLRVVMFSAEAAFEEFEETVREEGALACIQTPFNMETLLDTVDRALHA